MPASNASAQLDLAKLWDFSNPALSEQRFLEALALAKGDEALILQTQIARSHGLRKDFQRARELLQTLRPSLASAGAEARVRFALEWGRSWASAKHTPQQMDEAAQAQARAAWTEALNVARAAGLDALAIDAVHMFAFIDTTPEQQLHWGEQALALSLASAQPPAQRWQASIRHNLGMALHGLKRFDEALAQFKAATALRQAQGDGRATQIGRWMEAWTLRAMGRSDEALAMQLALEAELAAAGKEDEYVFEELQLLYRERGDAAKEAHYGQSLKQARR